MLFSKSVKPISYLKQNTAEAIREVNTNHSLMVITQNGEAKVVLQDLKEYEQQNESLAMLKLIAMGKADLKAQRYQSLDDAFESLDRDVAEARAKYE
jgi:prevent-host-death family protein